MLYNCGRKCQKYLSLRDGTRNSKFSQQVFQWLCTLITHKERQNFRIILIVPSSKISQSQNWRCYHGKTLKVSEDYGIKHFQPDSAGDWGSQLCSGGAGSAQAAGGTGRVLGSDTARKNKGKGELSTPVMRHFKIGSHTEKRAKSETVFK